ncbi:hypothetical protein T484DRAFT_1954281 [Baffinella frigidus]|nr:hypothetical protein T484DRAFT_1954281 [Cryptophyta sp. CCMP2293]
MLEDEVLFMQFIKVRPPRSPAPYACSRALLSLPDRAETVKFLCVAGQRARRPLSQNTLEDTMRRKEVRRARYEAFAMGQLERLGAGSRVRGLDPGVVGMVLEQLSKLDKSPQVPTFNSPPSCPQQVPGYPGLWPNGDAGCFHPAALNAIYIVSRDGFSLPTNNHGSFWQLNPSSKRCEMGTGVPGLRMLVCVCRPRIAQNLLMFATPFVPFKFRVEGLPEGLYLVCNMRPRRMQRRPEGHA